MRLKVLPDEIYKERLEKTQALMRQKGFDLIVCYGSEGESHVLRYFSDFWPSFDFSSILIPKEGEAILLIGGPESLLGAKKFSKIKNIEINTLLVETSAPQFEKEFDESSFSGIIKKYNLKNIKKVGISNYNIFPYIFFQDIISALPGVEFLNADELILEVQSIKSEIELPYIEEAFKIAEQSLITVIEQIKAGMTEYEVEAIARQKMLELGAEGQGYSSWVSSGHNTALIIYRSTDKKIEKNELIQLTFGPKYMGYCGSICRPLSIGKPQNDVLKLMEIGVEASNYAVDNIKPGKLANDIFKGYYEILSKHKLEEFALYGPAHGTGHAEVEGLWMGQNANYVIKPNMLFNIDIWLTDGVNGVIFEDGILITENGIKLLTSYRRELIIL